MSTGAPATETRGDLGQNRRALIVGCGRIAGGYNDYDASSILTHVVAYRHFGADVVGCCDRDPARAEQFARRWAIGTWGTDVEALLDRTSPDVVSVCTPPAGRKALLQAIFHCGSVRALLVEKPLAASSVEAADIRELINRSGVPTLVNYFRAFDPFYRELARVIDSGEAGALLHATCVYYGSALTNASHLLERLIDMMGTPDCARNLGGTDAAPLFELTFPTGATALMVPAPLVRYAPLEMDLFFERARIRVVDGEQRAEWFDVAPDLRFPGFFTLIPRARPWAQGPSVDAFAAVFESLLRTANLGESHSGSVSRAAAVTGILESVGARET